jgi:hypothetical protein
MKQPTLQYQGLSAPLMPPRPQDVGAGWMGSCLPPTRRVFTTALLVAACVLPAAQAAPAPALSWKAQYPDRIVRRTVPTAQQLASVLPRTLAQGAVTPPTGWRPTYPDRIVRQKVLTAQRPAYFSRELVAEAPAATSGGSFISTGAIPILQYQALAAPFREIVASAFTDQIFTGQTQIARVRPGIHASRQPFWFFDQFDAPAEPEVEDVSWQAVYPDRIARKRQTPLSASDLAPTFATFIDLNWRPIYPVQHLTVRTFARYVWPQPYFVVEVDVPVMSWTGSYLETAVVRRKAQRQLQAPTGTLEPTLLSESTAPPELSWQARYPERVRGRALVTPSGAANPPLFIPGETNPVTALSWQGRYADRVPGRKFVLAPPAFSFDRFTAPTPVVVPDDSTPVYVHRVYAKARPTWAPDETAPNFVPDVTQPVTPLSWDAQYVDQVFPLASLRTALQQALMMDAEIAPPVVLATPVKGRNRVGIPRRQRTAVVRGHQRIVNISRTERDE